MPMRINVGLSRKMGEANFGSRGASVNVEMELDSSLAADPAKLQDHIRQLFGLVRNSVAEELNGGQHALTAPPTSYGKSANGHDAPPPRPATQSQVRAIKAICTRQHLDLAQLLHHRFHLGRPEELTIRQASQLIDSLKQEGG